MTNNDKLPLIILSIFLLIAVSQIQVGDFILYQGVELKNATISNTTEFCFTLGANDRCVKQEVFMIELESGVLLCPELFYPTDIQCRHAFNLIPEIKKPKVSCYYIDEENDVCLSEQFEDSCPSQYFTSKEACTASLIDIGYSAKQLFSARKTWIMVGIGLVALLFMGIGALRKRG